MQKTYFTTRQPNHKLIADDVGVGVAERLERRHARVLLQRGRAAQQRHGGHRALVDGALLTLGVAAQK